MDIKLGDFVRDRLTGFEGIAEGRATYLYSNSQTRVISKEMNNQSPVAVWFDDGRLDIVEPKANSIGYVPRDGK
jgi:hypothetical protein